MNKFKAIETEYNGYKFRSRLEARWAVFFDSLGIKYEYEPEGIEFDDGTKYLPDFYLPMSKQWFEVKGEMEEEDKHKILSLVNLGEDVVVGYADGVFQTCSTEHENEKYALDNIGWGSVKRCNKCHKVAFYSYAESNYCKCCGEKGNKDTIMLGNYKGQEKELLRETLVYEDEKGEIVRKTYYDIFYSAWDCARKARFEFGETPQFARKEKNND